MTAHRRIRHTAIAAAAALALMLLLSPLAAAAGLAVRPAGDVTFPDRNFIVSVPQGTDLTSSTVHITENGRPVSGVAATPLSQSGNLGMIVAIDSDPSMAGAPLAQAMAAARTLASHRSGNEELGVVYGDGTSVPLTNDPGIIGQALTHTPRIGHAINLLEATKSAIDQLTAAGITDGAVIFVTDDIDRDARYTPEAIAAFARAAHVRIFAVGIRDRAYSHPNSEDLPPQAMATLATSTGGTFTAGAPQQVAGIFSRIEAGLHSEYAVSYRSTAPANGRSVSVTLTVDGVGSFSGSYRTPPAASVHHAATTHSQPFLNSTNIFTIAAIISAAFLAIALVAMLSHLSRGEALRGRVTAFAPEADPEPEILPDVKVKKVNRLLSRRRWWPAFEENVDVGRMTRTPKQLAYIGAAGSIVTFVLLKLLIGVAIVPLGAMALSPFVVRALVNRAASKQRFLFMEQFPGLIHEVAGAMRTGRSLVEALGSVTSNADEPSRREFEQALADERAGRYIEDALRTAGNRMQCEEIEQVAVVAALHRRTGANITEVLDRVADSARQRAEIRRELRSLTAQARMSRNVLVALPPFVVIALAVIAGSFERPLYATGAGRIVLAVCSMMVGIGAKVMKSIVNIEE